MLVIVMLGVGGACGHSPTTPTPPSLAGTWTGTGFFTGGSTTLRVGQTGSAVSGTWTSTQENPDTGGTTPGPSGTVNGVVTGATVSLTFAVDAVTTDCTFPIGVSATLTSERMTGTYATATATCPLKLSGTIVLTRTSAG
jgi:hypothetical protein